MTNSKSFQVAWARRDDAASIVPLLTALYKHEFPTAPEPSRNVVDRHVAQLLAPETPHKLAIVWSEDAVAVGLAAVARFVSVSDPHPDHWTQMELKELFVLPEHRGAGLGKTLMTWIEAEARAAGAYRIDWHVKKENARGIAFYERLGATVVQNRLSMRKSLLHG